MLNKFYIKENLELDFELIAITAPLKDYILCHKINKALNIDLCRVDDHSVFLNPNNQLNYFSKYSQFFEDTEQEFTLLSNRNLERHLVEELSYVDYFLIIHQFIDDEDLTQVVHQLKNIPEVQSASLISINKLKSKENLVI